MKSELTTLPELPDIDIPDLNLPGLIELRDSILNLEDVPPKAAIVLGLSALGFNPSRVSKLLGCHRQTVADYIHRYDPEGLCKVSSADKRVLTTQMLGATAIAAMMEITQKKLAESSAKDLAAIAGRCATTAEALNQVKKGGSSVVPDRMNAMMEALDVAEVV